MAKRSVGETSGLGPSAQITDRMFEPLGVAKQSRAGDENVGASGGRAGDRGGPDSPVDFDVDLR